VDDHDPPAGSVGLERRLGGLPAAGGGVAGVADGQVVLASGQGGLVEHFAHQPHLPVHEHAAAVGDGHAGRPLAAVLERVEPVEHGDGGGLGKRGGGSRPPRRPAPEDPALARMVDT
jgi:hypothetical protein